MFIVLKIIENINIHILVQLIYKLKRVYNFFQYVSYQTTYSLEKLIKKAQYLLIRN